MIFKTTKRIDKSRVVRITIPAQAVKILKIHAGDRLKCGYDYGTQILYYHPDTFRGNIVAGRLIVASPAGSASIVLPKEYCNLLDGERPFITVTIDPDTWDFRVTPEEKACNLAKA